MRQKNLLQLFVLVGLTMTAPAFASDPVKNWRAAYDLYQGGMYEQARIMFESLGKEKMSDGYAALCALKMRTKDAFAVAEKYQNENPESAINSSMDLEMAQILFDRKEWDAAAAKYDKVQFAKLDKSLRAEYLYKRGYCDFVKELFPQSKVFFTKLEQEPFSEFHAAGRYAMGFMNYTEKNFTTAENWFKLAVSDPRFKDISEFYIVDCEFMAKNYSYVITEGERIYKTSPDERKPHLARIISESYLVAGNSSKALEFFDKGALNDNDLNRSDYFYAGTVLYEVGDYAGAIQNYEKMTPRTDSLGQIANYHLANSYIKTKNKVAAMASFKDASAQKFDSVIAEDAFFNYAKLAFDLNQDPAVFEEYLKKYSTSQRGERIYTYIALSALYRRDYAAAIAAYDKIDELDQDMKGNYAKANYLRAAQLISSGSYSDAIPYLKATSFYLGKHDKFAQLAKYWISESYFNSEKFEEAANVLTELYNASALDGMNEGKLLAYNIAYSYFRLTNMPQASKWFDTYLRSGNPMNREDAVLRRADCDFEQKNYGEAVKSYGKAAEEFPGVNNIYPYYRQALSYGLDGDQKNKVATLKKILEANPDSEYYSDAVYELGRAYVDTKNNTAAIETFTKLLSTTNDNSFKAKSLIGLGMVYRNQKKYESALTHYKQAVAIAPDSEYAEDAVLAIESIYQKLKHPEKYLEFMESAGLVAGKTDEEKEAMYFNSAEQLYLGSNWEQAVSSLEKYIGSYPSGSKLSEAHFYLAEAYKALDKKEKSCDEYEKYLELAPEGSFREQSLLASANLNYALERYSKSYESYRNLLASAKFDMNKDLAKVGMMRSAFNLKDFASAVRCASLVNTIADANADLKREAGYVKAKSLLQTSHRDEAFVLFKELAQNPATDEGAEAAFLVIQDTFDKGDFASVDSMVYNFSSKAPNQSYWLARAYVILGDSFIERNNLPQAKATFESLKNGYRAEGMDDDVPDIVSERLEKIQTLMSK